MFDCFLKIEGVEGESTDEVHAGEIEISSFNWGGSNPAAIGSHTTGSGGGKVSLSNFSVMKRTDKASAALFQKMCRGDHFPTATVTLRKSGGDKVEFLVYNFEEVFVDSMNWSGSQGGDDSPMESVSFSFGKIEAKYKLQEATGGEGAEVVYSHDLRTNVSA